MRTELMGFSPTLVTLMGDDDIEMLGDEIETYFPELIYGKIPAEAVELMGAWPRLSAAQRRRACQKYPELMGAVVSILSAIGAAAGSIFGGIAKSVRAKKERKQKAKTEAARIATEAATARLIADQAARKKQQTMLFLGVPVAGAAALLLMSMKKKRR